jgi:hypothetical protein
VTGSGVDNQAPRLVDDDKVLVLENNVEWDLLRLERGLGSLGQQNLEGFARFGPVFFLTGTPFIVTLLFSMRRWAAERDRPSILRGRRASIRSPLSSDMTIIFSVLILTRIQPEYPQARTPPRFFGASPPAEPWNGLLREHGRRGDSVRYAVHAGIKGRKRLPFGEGIRFGRHTGVWKS